MRASLSTRIAAIGIFGAVLLALAITATSLVAAPLVTLTNFVVDQAGLLSPDQKARIIQKLRAHEAATSNQVAVATVQSLNGEVLEQAALEILRSTGLGQRDRNNGVLLLIAVQERKIRIEVGYGLEGVLTDGLSGQIIRQDISPMFKAGNPAGGIEAGVDAILAAIKGEYIALPSDNSPTSEDDIYDLIPFAMVIFYILIVLFIRHRRRAQRRAAGYGDNDHFWNNRGGYGGNRGGFGSSGYGSGGFGGGGSGGGGGASGGW